MYDNYECMNGAGKGYSVDVEKNPLHETEGQEQIWFATDIENILTRNKFSNIFIIPSVATPLWRMPSTSVEYFFHTFFLHSITSNFLYKKDDSMA